MRVVLRDLFLQLKASPDFSLKGGVITHKGARMGAVGPRRSKPLQGSTDAACHQANQVNGSRAPRPSPRKRICQEQSGGWSEALTEQEKH